MGKTVKCVRFFSQLGWHKQVWDRILGYSSLKPGSDWCDYNAIVIIACYSHPNLHAKKIFSYMWMVAKKFLIACWVFVCFWMRKCMGIISKFFDIIRMCILMEQRTSKCGWKNIDRSVHSLEKGAKGDHERSWWDDANLIKIRRQDHNESRKAVLHHTESLQRNVKVVNIA